MGVTGWLTLGGATLVVVLLAVRPLWGVGALLAFYPLIPFVPRSPVPGFNAETILVSFAMILTFARSGMRLPPLSVAGPLLAFLAVVLIGWFVANASGDPLIQALDVFDRLKAAKSRAFTCLLFFVVYWRVTDRRQIVGMLTAISLGTLFISVAAILSFILGLGSSERASGLFTNSNLTGDFLAVWALVPLYLMRQPELSRLVRALQLVSYGLAMLALVLTLSRGGWVASVVAHGFFLLWLNRKLLVVGVVALLLAGTVAFPLVPGLIRERITGTFEGGSAVYQVAGNVELEGSAGIRVAVYRTGLDLFLKSPLWGHGGDTFSALSQREGARYGVYKARSPHSLFVKLAAEFGLIGLGMLAWLSLAVLTLGWRLFSTRGPDRELGALLLSAGFATGAANLFHTDFLISAPASGFFWALLAMAAQRFYATRRARRSLRPRPVPFGLRPSPVPAFAAAPPRRSL